VTLRSCKNFNLPNYPFTQSSCEDNFRMPSENTSTPKCPDNLTAVPENARIPEVFGWAPLGWACILMLWCSVLFTQPAKPTRNEYAIAAIAFLLALSLIVFDLHRRRSRRTLARLPEHPAIGIYKDGILKRTLPVEKVTLELRHSGAGLGAVVAPGAVALGLAVFLVPGNLGISTAERIDAVLGALGFASLAGSAFNTYWLCEVCMFPHEKNKWRERILGQERILVRKRELPLLLSRQQKRLHRSSAEKLES